MSGEENEAVDQKIQQPEMEVSARKIDPGFKRNIVIIGSVFLLSALVIVGIVVLRSGNNDKKNTSSIGIGVSQNTVGTGVDQLSPALSESIKAKQEIERQDAMASGKPVYIPPDILKKEEKVVQPVVVSQNSTPTQSGVNIAPTLNPEDVERLARRRAGLARQMGSFIETGERQLPVRTTFSLAATEGSSPVSPAAQPAPPTNSATQSVVFASPPLIGALEIVPAEVSSPIDSYKTNYASARIVAGKLNGAFLVGAITQTAEGLQITYNQMRFKDKAYAIDAISLDEKTSTNAMDADVDRRYLQRFVFPVATAAVGAFATAVSRPAASSVSTPTSTTVITPSATTQEARAAGFAAGLGMLQREVDKEAARPLQLQLKENTPIGIMFRKPVAFQ